MTGLTPERLAKIRADDEAAGPWLGGPDEKFRFVNQRRDLLAHIDRLTAERDAAVARVAELEAAQQRGRCGDRLTGIAWRSSDPRQPLLICALPHGHPGWHRSDDGGEWTPLDGSKPQP